MHSRFVAALLMLAMAAVGAAAQEKPDSSKPWSVDAAHGPVETVSFTTDEGTWLSLDVSPDGRQIVFSLLGDLYMLPIEGGQARRITSGPAYDVQPRFSPDGKWIAFASDRGGMENIWIADLDGKNARQVSSEKDSTVSNPAWSPDGDYIVGRKRLTDTSSIGLVELWMWHLKGGKGVQVTSKDKQADASDPVFSRDGRFVYFSARDGRYNYNRSVDQGIWQIKRFDRVTGQILPLTGEFGGAAAPTVSPDGKWLAYTRRIRSKTVLEVMDLASGAVRQVAEGLERDNQEGFCFHGTFPGYAWTPDGKSIVATADGKIWRFDVQSGARAVVAFNAEVEQQVADAVRFTHRIGDDTMHARIIRWPVQSPDGRRLVFSAVGHLYTMDLPNGTPRRLTQNADLEYCPSFSADGRQLAFVTWNDETGGNVWTASFSADGSLGAPRRVTQVPSQYANPAFSPDGSKVVFVKSSGATLRGEDLSDELWHELHWAPSGGGPSHYIIGVQNRGQNRRMPRPAFAADGERVFYVDTEPGKPFDTPKTVLSSVKLDGTDKQDRLRWARAEEASVSPDGKWVAFNELHNAYITALPETGATVDISTEGGALPVAQLTDEGGEWVGWADGGRTVTWSFGPVFHRLSLDKAFPAPEPADAKPADPAAADKDKAKPKKKELPESESIAIDLALPRARPTGVVAYTNARIVTMKGDEVIEKGTIVVDGNRITAVGTKKDVQVPAGAKTVDLAGKTIIPGLVDEHAHLHYSTLDIFPQRPWKYQANLAYGVTTTHDPSASSQEVFGQSEMVEAGIITGPRIFSTGFILYGAENPERAIVNSLDDARRHLRRLKSLGAFTVKSYMQPRREQRQWILQAAREEGMMVVPEGGGDLEMDMTMILDGHTTIEHALPITPIRKDVVTLFARSKTSYTPTLLVAYGGLWGENWFYQHYDVYKNEKLLRFVPQGMIDTRSRQRMMAADDMFNHIAASQGARDVLRAGGRVCLGAHGQLQGLGPHWEMWALAQGGMTPMEALRASTLAPAQTLGLDSDIGSIEPGKLADFVILERNPLEKIENSDSVEMVVKNGVAYTLDELAHKGRFSMGGGAQAEPVDMVP